jgi:hypothetical protein
MSNLIGKLIGASAKSLGISAAILLALACGSARAQTSDPSVTYHIDFGTDFNFMMNPMDPVAMHYAMWKTPVQYASLRSAPFVRITNDSTSAMQMKSVRIDFGDPRFMFDSFAFFEQPDDGVATISSHTDLGFMGDMKPFLQVEFPSGLNPGDSFTFQVRIANTSTGQLADYETSLWHKDFAQIGNRNDNGLVSVVYQDTVGGVNTTLAMTPVRFFEYPLANANFAVDANGASGNVMSMQAMHDMTLIGSERFTQSAIVPEPSTLVLLGASMTAVPLAWRRRRRRVATAAA